MLPIFLVILCVFLLLFEDQQDVKRPPAALLHLSRSFGYLPLVSFLNNN